jgi:hypothetical protein
MEDNSFFNVANGGDYNSIDEKDNDYDCIGDGDYDSIDDGDSIGGDYDSIDGNSIGDHHSIGDNDGDHHSIGGNDSDYNSIGDNGDYDSIGDNYSCEVLLTIKVKLQYVTKQKVQFGFLFYISDRYLYNL